MPHQSDNPDRPSTLPQPDLNPLLNPVLAKNIGRWAEVYFTNPPEKRERALQQLVRELERENPIPETALAPQPSPRQHSPEVDHALASATSEVQAQGVTCQSCGYVNRPRHKFCGRCGMRMTAPIIDDREQEPPTDFLVSSESPEPESPIFGLESTPRWQSYRFYAGVALAVVVLILGYIAWRSAQTTSLASHEAPQATPAVTNPVAPAPAPANPEAATPSHLQPRTGTAPATQTPVRTIPANAGQPRPVAPIGAISDGTSALTGDGSEELAVARDFLNGANGRKPNPADAVPLLWKAVAKKNIAAAVLLSSLYLRGEGVPRNCEQAHLLLDAAAVKGRKDAAELLRNLQAFGCQ